MLNKIETAINATTVLCILFYWSYMWPDYNLYFIIFIGINLLWSAIDGELFLVFNREDIEKGILDDDNEATRQYKELIIFFSKDFVLKVIQLFAFGMFFLEVATIASYLAKFLPG